jgi:hypothetical protein
MSQTKRINLALLAPAALLVFVAARADDDHNEKLSTYKKVTTISIPDLVGFDISWVDSESARYYLADRGTGNKPATPRIDVIDTDKNRLLDPIPLTTAPNGVVAIHRTGSDDDEDQPGTLVVGGADSTAIFIDLAPPWPRLSPYPRAESPTPPQGLWVVRTSWLMTRVTTSF